MDIATSTSLCVAKADLYGAVLSEKVEQRMEHAWCKRDRFAATFAMLVSSRMSEQDVYAPALQPKVENRYSSDDAVMLSLKIGTMALRGKPSDWRNWSYSALTLNCPDKTWFTLESNDVSQDDAF